jgi:hypothetical protein
MRSDQNREVNSEETARVYSTGGVSISRTKRLPDGWFPSQPPNKKMLFATTVAVCPYLLVRKGWTTYAKWDKSINEVSSVRQYFDKGYSNHTEEGGRRGSRGRGRVSPKFRTLPNHILLVK